MANHGHDILATGPGLPRVARGVVYARSRCPCGTVLEPGDEAWTVEGVSPSWETLFAARSFCTLRCVRAFLLESIEMIDSINVPSAAGTVVGLPEAQTELRQIYARAVAMSAATLRA